MKSFLLVCVLVFTSPNVLAQGVEPCAQILAEADTKLDAGTPLVFTASLNKLRSSRGLKFKWQVSAGTIISGQNTFRVVVDTTGLGGQVIKATLEISGRNWNCSPEAKSVQLPLPPIVCGLAFDQYGDIDFDDEKARLDNFVIQLFNQPSARGAIITFAGNPTYPGEAALKLQRAKNYLVNYRGFPADRLITTDAGHRIEVTTYLYVVPKGAPPPTFESELQPAEVQFTKRPPP